MTMNRRPRLMAVGPLPPPLGGVTISFRLFCDEVKRCAAIEAIEIVDTAPTRLKKGSGTVSSENLFRLQRTIRQSCQRMRNADCVLVFGSSSHGFLLVVVPLLLVVATAVHKPCYVRVSGGVLDQYCDNLTPLLRWFLLFTLRNCDGVIVETELVRNHFAVSLSDKLHVVPGYRQLDAPEERPSTHRGNPGPDLNLVYLSHVREEKGIFVLLESLRTIGQSGKEAVHCDIYGPVFPSDEGHFKEALAGTPNATFRGILAPEQVVPTLRGYDALVLPTHYRGEGHPGVVIEAMMAGIPIIATDFRSIPELVQDRVNGLLAKPRDAKGLAEAIRTIYHDRGLLAEMASRSFEMRTRYDVHTVVPQILRLVGVQAMSVSGQGV